MELGLGIILYVWWIIRCIALGMLFDKPNTKDALIGFSGMVALLFMVNGPVQTILPGDGLIIAWPLYTLFGSIIVIVMGVLSSKILSNAK